MKKQPTGVILFIIYLYLFMFELAFLSETSSIIGIIKNIAFLPMVLKIGLLSRIVMLAMFGILLATTEEEKINDT